MDLAGPSVEAVRPAHCVRCKAASRPVGQNLVVVGHGLRERQVLGVQAFGGRPLNRAVNCRRYRCLQCQCVMVVVPAGVFGCQRYTLLTIALALVGVVDGVAASRLRKQLSPLETFEEGWASIRRWLRAVRVGKLFRWILGVSEQAGRGLAQRVVTVLAATAGRRPSACCQQERVCEGVLLSYNK